MNRFTGFHWPPNNAPACSPARQQFEKKWVKRQNATKQTTFISNVANSRRQRGRKYLLPSPFSSKESPLRVMCCSSYCTARSDLYLPADERGSSSSPTWRKEDELTECRSSGSDRAAEGSVFWTVPASVRAAGPPTSCRPIGHRGVSDRWAFGHTCHVPSPTVLPRSFHKQPPPRLPPLPPPPPRQDYRDQWAHAPACIKRMS